MNKTATEAVDLVREIHAACSQTTVWFASAHPSSLAAASELVEQKRLFSGPGHEPARLRAHLGDLGRDAARPPRRLRYLTIAEAAVLRGNQPVR